MNKSLCTVEGCRNFQRYCRIHLVETFKPSKPVNKVSDPLKEAQKEYKPLAKTFITLHPKCQVKGCVRPSECIHHQRGRIGDLLTDTRYFLAVCMPCHQKIETHPAWAKEMGFSFSRHKKRTSATNNA